MNTYGTTVPLFAGQLTTVCAVLRFVFPPQMAEHIVCLQFRPWSHHCRTVSPFMGRSRKVWTMRHFARLLSVGNLLPKASRFNLAVLHRGALMVSHSWCHAEILRPSEVQCPRLSSSADLFLLECGYHRASDIMWPRSCVTLPMFLLRQSPVVLVGLDNINEILIVIKLI